MGIYIPLPGFYFRLFAVLSQTVLYANLNNNPVIGKIGASQVYNDQWFHLGVGASGTYTIQSYINPNKVLYMHPAAPQLGLIAGSGQYADNFFTFEEGTGVHAQHFRIKSNGNVLYAQNNGNNQVGCIADTATFEDQWFKFIYEDMDIAEFTYNLASGTIGAPSPITIFTDVLDNSGGSTPKQQDFYGSKVIGQTSAFTRSSGADQNAGWTFSVGIPYVGDTGTLQVSALSQPQIWGQTVSTPHTYSVQVPVTAAPFTRVVVVASVKQSLVTVPYTIKLQSRISGQYAYSYGTWNGLATWGLTTTTANI